MKYSATFITVGAGFAAALPNAAVPRQDLAAQHPWKAPGPGDVRAPCPGLNTLANHGFLPRDGKQISLDMVVKAFKDGFNMGSDIITSAGGSALSVCQQVTKAPCKAFNLDQLNTPHTFEHDASFTREDYNFGKGNNHDFSPAVFQTVLDVWKDTDVITYSYANAARLMRIQASKQNDAPGWFTESDGTQLTEVAFYMGTMGTPQDGNARKDWVTYWWTHERMPFELGWAPDQRPEHNQSTINTMINNIINAPAPPSVGKSSSSSAESVASSTSATTAAGSSSSTADNSAVSSTTDGSAVSSTTDGSAVSSTTDGSVVSTTDGSVVSTTEAPCTLPVGYGFTSDASTIEIVPITSTDGSSAPVATLPEGWTFTTAGTSSLVAFQPTPTSVAADTSSTDLASSAAATSSTDSATRPTGFTSFAGNDTTTAPPSTVTFLTTSIGYAVTEITVTGGCTANATDCSSTESATATVITSTISSFTTLCPVTATIVPTGQDLITTTTAPAADSSSSSTDSASASSDSSSTDSASVSTDSASVSSDSSSTPTDTPTSSAAVSSTIAPVSFTYTQPTAPITFVSGNLVVPTTTATAAVFDNSTATAVTTDAATTSVAVATIPNPYFQSVAPEVFPSVPSEIISQYSATTGVYAAPSLAPQYTQTGSAAIAAATSGVVIPPAAPAPSASADVATSEVAATTTTAAADFGYGAGSAQSTAAIVASNSTGAPIQQSNDGSRQAVNGLLAGLAVAVMML